MPSELSIRTWLLKGRLSPSLLSKVVELKREVLEVERWLSSLEAGAPVGPLPRLLSARTGARGSIDAMNEDLPEPEVVACVERLCARLEAYAIRMGVTEPPDFAPPEDLALFEEAVSMLEEATKALPTWALPDAVGRDPLSVYVARALLLAQRPALREELVGALDYVRTAAPDIDPSALVRTRPLSSLRDSLAFAVASHRASAARARRLEEERNIVLLTAAVREKSAPDRVAELVALMDRNELALPAGVSRLLYGWFFPSPADTTSMRLVTLAQFVDALLGLAVEREHGVLRAEARREGRVLSWTKFLGALANQGRAPKTVQRRQDHLNRLGTIAFGSMTPATDPERLISRATGAAPDAAVVLKRSCCDVAELCDELTEHARRRPGDSCSDPLPPFEAMVRALIDLGFE